jgi:hypothetical protein
VGEASIFQIGGLPALKWYFLGRVNLINFDGFPMHTLPQLASSTGRVKVSTLSSNLDLISSYEADGRFIVWEKVNKVFVGRYLLFTVFHLLADT